LQHVLAMFVGNLSPLPVILATCGITDGEGFGALRIALLQNAMIIAGLITFIQLYPIGPIGGRLPIVMGTSSGFIGINNAIATSLIGGNAAGTISTDANAGIFAYGAIMGACIIGGAFEMGLGFESLRRFFPPIVTGTVVMSIGLSLIPVGINFFGGGANAADFDNYINYLQPNDYYEMDPEDYPEGDVIGLLIKAHAVITRKDSPIENVVLDMSASSGGSDSVSTLVVAWLLGEANPSFVDMMTGAMTTNPDDDRPVRANDRPGAAHGLWH